MKCYQCGTCTADCTSANVNDGFNPRRMMLEYLEEGKLSELCWLCASCFKCYRCPKNVKPYEVMAEMRAEYIKMGKVPAYVKAFVETVKDYGELDETAFFIKLAKAGMIMDVSVILSTVRKRGVKAFALPKKSGCAKEVSKIFAVIERSFKDSLRDESRDEEGVKRPLVSGVPA